jgi:hypothetical protein
MSRGGVCFPILYFKTAIPWKTRLALAHLVDGGIGHRESHLLDMSLTRVRGKTDWRCCVVDKARQAVVNSNISSSKLKGKI